MPAEFKNTFAWSSTRDATFQSCLRQYYFQYYGFWGGWKDGVSSRTKQIYVLKQLQSRHQWAGGKVHECIQRSLTNLRRGVALLSPDEAVDITLKGMRSDFRHSRSKGYWKTPKSCALFEHEYDLSISDEAWRAVAQHVTDCLRALYASLLWEELKAVPARDWLEVEEFSHFLLDGVTVFVKLDCSYRDKDRIRVLDWKTGRAQRESNVVQMVCYTLYACEKWRVQPEDIRASEVFLPGVTLAEYRASHVDIENARAYIRGSISDMLSLLKDKRDNVPLEEAAFSLREDDTLCQSCNFRKVCPK